MTRLLLTALLLYLLGKSETWLTRPQFDISFLNDLEIGVCSFSLTIIALKLCINYRDAIFFTLLLSLSSYVIITVA